MSAALVAALEAQGRDAKLLPPLLAALMLVRRLST